VVVAVVAGCVLEVRGAPQGTNSEEYCSCLASCYQGPCGVCVGAGHVPEEVLPGSSKKHRHPVVRHLWPEATPHEANEFASRWTDIGVPGFCRMREARHQFTGRCFFDAETDGGRFVPPELRCVSKEGWWVGGVSVWRWRCMEGGMWVWWRVWGICSMRVWSVCSMFRAPRSMLNAHCSIFHSPPPLLSGRLGGRVRNIAGMSVLGT
jgi:hypothetical protein